MSEQECPLTKRIEFIKHNVIGQIFRAGADHNEEFYEYIDDNGNITQESQNLLD